MKDSSKNEREMYGLETMVLTKKTGGQVGGSRAEDFHWERPDRVVY